MPQLLKVQNFTVSADGYGAGDGDGQSLQRPFGHADLISWAFPTASFPGRTTPGGTRGLDDHLARDFHHDIGAKIMGRNEFSPHRGPWTDHQWRGWWGDEPPFHTPVFVLTHHLRPSFTLADTTFHFVDGPPADVLGQARAAANGKDVRLGGGAQTIRAFLDADLIDTLHVVVAPCSSVRVPGCGRPRTSWMTTSTTTSSPVPAGSCTTCSGGVECSTSLAASGDPRDAG